MTQEEKAKAYDEALERAEALIAGETNTSDTLFYLNDIKSIFPELAESEDERIRKELIKFVKVNIADEERYIAWLEKQKEFVSADFDDVWDTADCDELTAPLEQYSKDAIKEMCHAWYDKGIELERKSWLEKQGEQRSKLVDFDYNAKDSDLQEVTYFIPNGFHAEIDGNKVVIKQGEQKPAFDFNAVDWQPSKVDGKIHNIYNSEVEPKFKVGDWVVDNCNNLWKIVGIMNGFYILEDGDEGGSRPTIEWVDKTFHLWTIQDAKDGDVLASKNGDTILIFRNLDTNTSFSSYYNIAGKGELGWSNERFIPATKEQRDQLEKAMTDAGYTFDFEKKELRKIEQKPDWSEEDEKIALSIEHVMNCASLLNIVPEKVDKIRTWIKSLKQRMEGKV